MFIKVQFQCSEFCLVYNAETFKLRFKGHFSYEVLVRNQLCLRIKLYWERALLALSLVFSAWFVMTRPWGC